MDLASQLGKPITQVEGYASDGLKGLMDSGNFSAERFSNSWNALRQESHPNEQWEVYLEKRGEKTYLVRKLIQP